METLLLTLFDLGHSRQWPMMMRFESGADVLLQGGREIVPDSLAQRDAMAENLPIVVVGEDAVRLLILGREALVAVEGGGTGSAMVRIMTADELLAKVEQAQAQMPAEARPPMMTREKAEELTRTL